jgi:putative transposase
MRDREVWQNYWDTCLTHEKSYLARMHYVMLNPVKHGFVADPAEYPFSSYCWFINHADQELKHKVLSSSVDRLNIPDGF